MYTQCQYLPSFYAGDVSGQQPTHSATVLEWEIAFILLYQVRSLQEYNSLFINCCTILIGDCAETNMLVL